jgi:hypothetical protein
LLKKNNGKCGIVINGVSKNSGYGYDYSYSYNYQEQSERSLGIKKSWLIINEFVNLE